MRTSPTRFALVKAVPPSLAFQVATLWSSHSIRSGFVQSDRASSSGSSARRRLAVPGTDILAHVAAEDPAVQAAGELFGDGPLVLDRPVADAPARVELVRSREGVGRAGIETPRAGSAVIGRDEARRQPARCPASSAPRNVKLPSRRSMSMVFLPIQPRPARRAKSRSSSGAVSTTARPRTSGHSPRSQVSSGFELVPENAMIIQPTSVTSDLPLGRAHWLGYGLTVNQADHHDRAHTFEQAIGMRPDLFMFLEVTHAGAMTGLEPFLKPAIARR